MLLEKPISIQQLFAELFVTYFRIKKHLWQCCKFCYQRFMYYGIFKKVLQAIGNAYRFESEKNFMFSLEGWYPEQQPQHQSSQQQLLLLVGLVFLQPLAFWIRTGKQHLLQKNSFYNHKNVICVQNFIFIAFIYFFFAEC